MSGKTKTKFIYFDMGGVLMSWRGSLVKLAEKYERDHDEFVRVFNQYDLHFCRGGFAEKEIWDVFKTLLKLPESREFDFTDFMTGHFIPIIKTHDLARSLAEEYKIGLLTNIYPGAFNKAINRGCAPDIQYQSIIKSYEVGYAKPDEQIYQIAQSKAGVEHEEILFIDDLVENLEVPKKLGWKTHLFDEHNPDKAVEDIRKILKLTLL